VLRRLQERQPGCFHFLIEPRPGSALVGASPERLVAVDGPHVRSMALAGSAPRSADPSEDAELGTRLLASDKDLAEHRVVVDEIRAALAPARVEAPDRPSLRRLATLQHLETPLSVRLSGQGDVIALAERLHPTPALGGSPRAAAAELIAALEDAPRGWYGGAVGWTDGYGNGDLCVAIRSVLINGREVTAFAGAGIVADSDPAAEVDEIELKLAAALSGLDDG
jgi:menaquinone-specific isochorismate synthase